jgi:hypothetical protein
VYSYNIFKILSIYDKNYFIIICPKHGKFKQDAYSHSRGHGCTKCSCSGWSKRAIDWLESIAKHKKIFIRHAANKGEKQIKYLSRIKNKDGKRIIKKFKIDGYHKETKTVYEFHGDFWHGNPKLYWPTDINSVNKKQYGQLFIKTVNKERMLRKLGFNYICIWENEWDNQININLSSP